MKILIVAPYFYPRAGGVENYAYNIAKGLAKNNNVTIITSNNLTNKRVVEHFDGLKVIRLPYWFKLSNTPINPLWYFDLKKIINDEKPDIINGHMPVPFMADIGARVKGHVPFVLTYHNDLVKDNWLNIVCKLYYLILGNKTLRISDKIIATSHYYAYQSSFLIKYKKKLEIVHPGVDFTKYNTKIKKGFLRKKLGLENQKLVLFVGQLSKTHIHKGLDYLIEAMSLVKDKSTILIIAGKGDYIEEYKKIAKKHKVQDRVIFLGFVPNEDLPKIYRDADITVLPSYSRAEGFGMVLHESLACGTPVIGTKIGGIPIALEMGKLGTIVEPKNPKTLAEEIQKNHKKTRLPHKYSWDGLIKKTKKILKCIN